jgi:hypothetical protein
MQAEKRLKHLQIVLACRMCLNSVSKQTDHLTNVFAHQFPI